MKIAVWHNLPSGGAKRALHDHVAGLVARGHEIHAWCPPTADQGYLPLGRICRETVIPLETPIPPNKRLLPRPLYPVRKMERRLAAMDAHCRLAADEIRAGGFDVLFANACAQFRTSPIGRHVRIPRVLYLQEPYRELFEALPVPPWAAPPRRNGPCTPSRFKAVVRDLVDHHAMRIQVRDEAANAAAFDRILVNSSFSRESVLRAYGLESRVCRLGIDVKRFWPTGEPRGDFVVSLGGLGFHKAPDRAIRAVGAVPGASRPRLTWIGNFALADVEREVRRLATELDVAFDVKTEVSDDELVSLLSRARAMVYAPRLEPFGLAPLEANACGTPVVGVAEGGLRETIRDGVNGLLAPDADPATIGNLLSRLLSSPSLLEEMGQNARAHVEATWSMTRAIDELERHLREVVESASGTSR